MTLVIVAGRYQLPSPGAPHSEALTLVDEQGDVRLADEYGGDPATPVLLREGQNTYTRPGTDFSLHGHAWAPNGKPASRSMVGLRVGRWHKHAAVFGDRTWTLGVGGVSPSRPAPFETLPLTYTRCFGGSPANPGEALAAAIEYNPVGVGLHSSGRNAIGGPLPNFEDPSALLQRPSDRPLPCGFGPIARHWRPRRLHAGTYDHAWAEQRAPLWPRDLDERFFSAAAPDLLVRPHLAGGEPVQIVGMSPAGNYEFSLPRVDLQARFEATGRLHKRRMTLDAIEFEPDASILTMYWRTFVASEPLTIGAVIVRTLDPWELTH